MLSADVHLTHVLLSDILSEEGMLEALLSCGAFLGIPLEHLQDEVDGVS